LFPWRHPMTGTIPCRRRRSTRSPPRGALLAPGDAHRPRPGRSKISRTREPHGDRGQRVWRAAEDRRLGQLSHRASSRSGSNGGVHRVHAQLRHLPVNSNEAEAPRRALRGALKHPRRLWTAAGGAASRPPPDPRPEAAGGSSSRDRSSCCSKAAQRSADSPRPALRESRGGRRQGSCSVRWLLKASTLTRA
jgi:hypothetical protein